MTRKKFIVSITCIFILLAPFIITSFYNIPYGDDFWYANMVKEYGKIGAVIQWYNTLSGRYFINVIISYTDPLVYRSFNGFIVAPLFCICSLWLTLYFLLIGLDMRKKDAVLSSGILTASYFLLMPDIREGLFWMSGMMNYHTGVLLFLWLVRGLVIFFKQKIISKRNVIIYTILSFLLMGINECIAFGWIGLLFFANAYQILIKKKYPVFLLSLFGAAFLGSLLVVFCPGNQQKAAEYVDENRNIPGALLNCFLGIGYYILKTLKSPFAWGSMLLSIAGAARYLETINRRLPFMPGIKTLLLFAFIFLMMMYFPAIYFGKDHIPPLRVSDTLVIFFIVIYLACLNYLPQKLIDFTNYRRGLLIRAGIVLCIAGLYFSNFSLLTKELARKEIQSYHAEVIKRYVMVESCKSDTCTVPAFKYYSIALAPTDINPVNDLAHINTYYGIKAIIIVP